MAAAPHLKRDSLAAGLLCLALLIVYGADLVLPAGARTAYTGRGSLLSGSMYDRRTAPNRQEWIADLGGSPQSEAAVKSGLEWLSRHQAQDGSWSARCLGHGADTRCEAERACSVAGEPYPYAQTGLALLAFQAGGHFFDNENTYSEHVRHGLDWLVDNQHASGALCTVQGEFFPHHYMYEHGIAAFALTEACAIRVALQQKPEPKYLEAAQRAIRFLLSQQHRDGGWRYSANLNEQSDTSVSGWQALAMKTAIAAKITVPEEAIRNTESFFQGCEMGVDGRTAYVRGNQLTEATTGVGMLVHQFLLNRKESPLIQEAAPHLANYAEAAWGGQGSGPADYYLWYNCTLAMFGARGEPWNRWNNVVRDRIVELQVQQGCERGSWHPDDQWGTGGGRIYSTALAVLTLEVYYRFSETEDH